MKIHRKTKEPATIRKGRGVLVVGQKTLQKEHKEESSICEAFSQVSYLNLYYKVGKVYAFTVTACVSDQKSDGTQQTKYFLCDKRGEKHTFYCDCTCFKIKDEILLRIKEIRNGQLRFESAIIERLDEIFEKGEAYEFEVISYQKGRYVVSDSQVGKNHYLSSNDSKLYKNRDKLKLVVQGFDDKGELLLADPNPPPPTEPWKNALQELAESMAKEQKNEASQVQNKQKLSSTRRRENQQCSSGTPKVAPSIAIPREDKRVLVQDLGYKLPPKEEKYVPQASEPKPVYTRSIKQPQVEEKTVDSFEDILRLAHKGDVECQFLAAQYYQEHGNKEEANKWYKIAAQKGHPEALYHYGMKYLRAARNYLEKAAKKNHAGARHELNKLNEAARNFNKKSVRYFVYYVVDNEQMNYPHCVKRVCNTVSSVVDDVWTYEWCESGAEVEAMPEELSVVQPFLAWIDGVSGMEKTTDYTVQSGHGEETETVEFPCYEMREADELAALAEQVEVKPWYVRVWQVIKSYFCKN